MKKQLASVSTEGHKQVTFIDGVDGDLTSTAMPESRRVSYFIPEIILFGFIEVTTTELEEGRRQFRVIAIDEVRPADHVVPPYAPVKLGRCAGSEALHLPNLTSHR